MEATEILAGAKTTPPTGDVARSRMLDINTQKLFGKYLEDDNINEIAYNGDNKIWVEDINGSWYCEFSDIDPKAALSFANAAASYNNDKVDKTKPILSCLLSTGERVQVVRPPAVGFDKISITIRKPSKVRYKIDDYIKSGALDENIANLLKNAIKNGKNLVICGETGSGKTTFMKTLIDFIPTSERLITIEDVAEIKFYEHENVVQMFYPSEAKDGDALTSATLLKSCLRMKPSRILLAEVRSGETYDFLNVISSGHNGSMTSCHAGSVKSCYNRLVMMAMQNLQARVLGRDMIMDIVKTVIDVIVVFKRHGGKRQIMEYMYDGKIYVRDENGVFVLDRKDND